MKYLLLALALFGGCTQAPALKIYTLELQVFKAVSSHVYRDKSLKVTYPKSLTENLSSKMNFNYSASERGTYQNSQWSNSLSKLFQGRLIELLDYSQMFKAILSESSSIKENYRLESSIFAFHHRVRGEASYAIVSIQFNLVNTQTSQLIKSKRLSYQEPTLSTDAKGYVNATNRAMNDLSKDLLKWLK